MNLPAPSKQASTGEQLSFMKAKNIPAKGTVTMKLLGNVREGNSQFGDGINIDVQVPSGKYTLTVKFESGNYRRLYDAFGKNPDKWKGKTVKVKRGEYLNNQYVQICD